MFLVNSCLGLFSVTCSRRHPLSRSYGVILQSSLTMILSPVLGFSPRLPVSVCGTGASIHLATFLASVNSSASLLVFTPRHRPALTTCVLNYMPASRFGHGFPSPCSDYPPVSLLHYQYRRYRNIYLLFISYDFRPHLSSRLTLGGQTFPRKP